MNQKLKHLVALKMPVHRVSFTLNGQLDGMVHLLPQDDLPARETSQLHGLDLWLVKVSAVGVPVGVLWKNSQLTIEEEPDQSVAISAFIPRRSRPADVIAVVVAPNVRQKPEVWPYRDSNDKSVHHPLGLKTQKVLGKIFQPHNPKCQNFECEPLKNLGT